MKTLLMSMTLLMAWLLPAQHLWADTVTQEQFNAAYTAITADANKDADGELWFHIFTYSEGPGTFGSEKYYLTDNGTLTTEETEAGTFHFVQVEDNMTGFSLRFSEAEDRAFYIKNGGNYFTNANRETGSQLRTSNRGRFNYEAQVFFLNSKGRYAVRSTNANAGTWWESAWWTVSMPGVACYTEPDADDEDIQNADFIWQIEKAEANDRIAFDTDETYHLSFSQATGSYKYLLSPLHYAAYGYEDFLLHRTNTRAKQMELKFSDAGNGKKNNFYMKDATSGYYIVPAENDLSGTEWAVSTEPAVVVLEMTGTADTYIMKNETGSKANPWGNDTDPYIVANYNGSNNVLITVAGGEDADIAAFKDYIKPAYDAITNTVNANEDGELWYRIYTEVGNSKYYLTNEGKLTTKAAEATAFNFVSVGEATSGLTEMAFFVKSGANFFTNANKAPGTNLRTSTRGLDTYEAQIFCLKNGKYAVRSTNAAAGDWWEQSWWTATAEGTACYTEPADENAAYIWQLETAASVDDAVHFEEGKYFTVTLNKNISYKFLQSPKYNEEGDNVLRRTNDEERMMQVTMTAVAGQKSTFTMQDRESGLYIVPAENSSNGTNWTVSEEPAPVIFAEVSANTYSLKGEAGGYANAYGDDNEAQGYRVANYGTPSQWIFTRIKTEEDINQELEEQQEMAYGDIIMAEYYRIFTTEADEDGTRYYLTTNGELTTNEEEAGSFNLIPVGADAGGFSNYAFYVKHGAKYFTNANKAEGESLRTATNGRATYDAQVFYFGENFKLAVRSTNAFAGSWWENAWWTVGVSEATGQPVACYTQPGDENRVYIWEMEEAEATDNIKFDADAEYTITLNKGIQHKYIQAPSSNDEGDDVVRRTTDAGAAVKLQFEEEGNQKNAFFIRDKQSGRYITPAADATNGTNWTWGSEPAIIFLEQLDEHIFTMKGGAGGNANAYGDDNEKEAFRVANYGTASQWIIAVAGSEQDPAGVTVALSSLPGITEYFTLQGVKTSASHKGIVIVRDSKGVSKKAIVK